MFSYSLKKCQPTNKCMNICPEHFHLLVVEIMSICQTYDEFQVAKLSYEAYDTMALKSMKRVCTEVRKKWPEVEKIAIYHRFVFF